jgi:yersiniabactin nonribosomal peptide/polyketide synthase
MALDMIGATGLASTEGAARTRLDKVFAQVFSSDLELAYWHVDRLCLHLCFHVDDECGLLKMRAEPLPDIAARVGVAPDAAYLVRAILEILCEEGVARCTPKGFCRVCQSPNDDSERMQREARAACPRARPIFEMIERCHRYAVDFLTGRRTGVSVVFEHGDVRLWERLHTVDRVMSIYADLVPPTLQTIVRPGMRLLEVGGGVGAALRRCLPMLERLGYEHYTFTDVGQSFVQAAQRVYSGNERISFARLNLDLPLRFQDAPSQGFDVIIAVNVLHVVRALSFSLRELHNMLRPLGYLLIAEGSPPDRSRRWRLDIVFAFLRGWWDVSLEPPWRQSPGFLWPSQWKGAVMAAGYDPVHALPGEEWFRGPCRGGVVLAQRPAG